MFLQWLTPYVTAPIFRFGGTSISVGWLVGFIALFVLVTGLTVGLKRLLKDRLLKRLGLDEGNREAIATLSSFAFGAFGYIIALQATGLNFASVAVLAGGLGVGIGFGLQDLAKNLASGLALLVERKLKVGDFIGFDRTTGHIKEISIRATTIRTIDGAELIVPNTTLTGNHVENWHYPNSRARIVIPVGVAYGTDPLLVTETLLEAAYTEKEIALDPAPKVLFQGFGDNSFHFELWVWVDRIEKRVFVRSSLHYIIEYHFRQRGIEIPFPQREVWMRQPAESDNGSEPVRPPSLKEMLREVSYFQSFDDLQSRRLIEMGCRKVLRDKEILVHRGDRADAFCVVLAGNVDAIYENDKISRKIFTFSKGQYFGELPLLLDVPYPTTMRSNGDTVLFMLERSGFQHLIDTYPDLADEIATQLAKRQDELQDYQQKLKEMGLLADEDLKNPVIWLKERLKRFFATA
jgi:small-conductance mechanosensitive channel